jgi:hypothetical protein
MEYKNHIAVDVSLNSNVPSFRQKDKAETDRLPYKYTVANK